MRWGGLWTPFPGKAAIVENSAPLGVRATLTSAHRSRDDGNPAAVASLIPDIITLFGTADTAEGIASFAERRTATFTGR
jgi:hypothetical protein